MDNGTESFYKQHKMLLKKFYIFSSRENLQHLSSNVIASQDDTIAEEFINLCIISVDKDKFEGFLLDVVKQFVWLGVKYYDKIRRYKRVKKVIEDEIKRIKSIMM